MVKSVCILALCLAIVTFLLFAFASWNINPAMWSDEGRIMCAVMIGIEILAIVLAITLSEGL